MRRSAAARKPAPDTAQVLSGLPVFPSMDVQVTAPAKHASSIA
jgi:muconolactone delta-isomerase